MALNEALARLGRNPQDVNALIDAGNTALVLGDVGAAVGFFARADQIQPNSARVRAGLAAALVHSGNPYDAIPLFVEAEAAGGMDARLLVDRGLAYDLVGDGASAQKYYRMAMGSGVDDEASRRLALSLAISGDHAGMEQVLAPLLQRGDKPAARIHAFALAIAGRPDEAIAIAYKFMPQDLAAGISPYLRYMPRLTRAQQAAAATFGHFPRAAEIGRDDPRVARFAPPVHVAVAETALVPKGEPLGAGVGKESRKDRDRREREARDGVASAPARPPQLAVVPLPPRAAPPSLQPSREESETPSLIANAPASPRPNAAQPVAALPAVVTVSTSAPPAPKPAVVSSPTVNEPQRSGVAVAVPAPIPSYSVQAAPPPQVPSQAAVASTVVTYSLPVTAKHAAPSTSSPAVVPSAPPRVVRVADAFGDLGAPETKAAPASGAVDIRKIAPTRPKSEPARPAHPSRIWVQVGTGRDKSALGFTWRGLVKDNPDLLRGKSPSITEWGRTNRLLTGPFETESAASAYLARLKRGGLDAFTWTSPAGQVVDPLSGK